jgi:phosphoglycerol transferase MdoB-like AlkP superfamily enzyme
MVFFGIIRLMFLFYNYELSFSMNVVEWGRVLLYGAWMDASMSGYLSAGAAMLLVFTSFAGGKTVSRTLSIYTVILMSVCGIMAVGDMELYGYWGFRLDSTPLMYLNNTPKEAFASISLLKIVFLVLLFAITIYLLWTVYRLVVRTKLSGRLPKAGWLGIPVFLIAGLMMIFPIRGGLGVAPMNTGFVYHHLTNIFANHASVNVVWNAMKSLMESDKLTGYQFMETEKAKTLFSECYPVQENTQLLLKEQHPNVIVIILERFSNRLKAPLGGKPDVTPYLNRL